MISYLFDSLLSHTRVNLTTRQSYRTKFTSFADIPHDVPPSEEVDDFALVLTNQNNATGIANTT
jgi:hypothetical protein